MTGQRKWLWIVGAIAVAAVALGAGVPLGTLLLVGLLLLCPAVMYFGMRGMGTQQEGRSERMAGNPQRPDPLRDTKNRERNTTPDQTNR
ncbi:MAG: hypothetical protein WD688_21155 [Candidatus Binatia bacterium]